MTDWRSSLRSDPIPWLLENGSAPLRFRTLTELLGRPLEDPDVQKAHEETLAHAPALLIQRRQRKDGTWGGRIHAGDPRRFQPCTENMLIKLFELGWGRDTKPVKAAAKMLRGLMATKKEIKLYEFAAASKADAKRERYYRWFVRTVALGLLVRAGTAPRRSSTIRSRATRPRRSGPATG
jgi:hypothetical protein